MGGSVRTEALGARIDPIVIAFVRAARAASKSGHVISQTRRFPMRNPALLFRTAITVLALFASAACSSSTTPTTAGGAGKTPTGSDPDPTQTGCAVGKPRMPAAG